VGARFSASVQNGPGTQKPPAQWVPCLFTGSRAFGVCSWQPTPV